MPLSRRSARTYARHDARGRRQVLPRQRFHGGRTGAARSFARNARSALRVLHARETRDPQTAQRLSQEARFEVYAASVPRPALGARRPPGGDRTQDHAGRRRRRAPAVREAAMKTYAPKLDPSTTLLGTMMDVPLTIGWIFEHVQRNHGAREVAARLDDGSIFHYTYAGFGRRVAQLA